MEKSKYKKEVHDVDDQAKDTLLSNLEFKHNLNVPFQKYIADMMMKDGRKLPSEPDLCGDHYDSVCLRHRNHGPELRATRNVLNKTSMEIIEYSKNKKASLAAGSLLSQSVDLTNVSSTQRDSGSVHGTKKAPFTSRMMKPTHISIRSFDRKNGRLNQTTLAGFQTIL